MGYQKKPFTLWKFRTMKNDAELIKKELLTKNEAPLPMFKIRHDPRHTKIGNFLSRIGVDELPQFFNILKGEMSVVGPRPLPIAEAQKLPTTWNFRYTARPGIFSEWAISTQRHNSLKKWQQLEKETLSQGNWKYDFKLFLRTVKHIFYR